MPEDRTSAERPACGSMRGVIPYLGLGDRAAEAVDFYIRAFGGRDCGRVADEENPGRLMHAQIEINGGMLMLTGCRAEGEEDAPPRGFHLQIVTHEADQWWERALAEGCKVRMPLEQQFWGDRWGMVEDPFGILWAVNEPAPGT